MHSILVSEYMDNDPHAINHSSSIRSAVLFLLREKISGAPVVDENKKLVGFISEQDCITEILNDAMYCEDSPPVTKLMTRDVITATPDTSIVELAEKMASSAARNYPVVQNGVLVGLINRSLIMKAILETNEDCYL
jgi:predicted transcriptional regulator